MLHKAEVTIVLWMNSTTILEDTTFIHANVSDLGCFLLGAITLKIFVNGFSEQQRMLSRYLIES